jgi:hypothetical protein
LTTIGAPVASIWAWAEAASVKRAQDAVGAPQASQTSLVKVLELSSRAAAFRVRIPENRPPQHIHSPVLKWCFGAYNYERNVVFLAECEQFSIVENINIRTFRDFGDPGIPGRDDQPSHFGFCRTAQASACSRPPPPRMRMFMAALL